MANQRGRRAAAIMMAGLLAGGCSLFDDDDADAEETAALADQLAAALTSGDFSGVAFTDDAAGVQETWDGIVEAMLPDVGTVAVEAGEVTVGDDDTATVTLGVGWDIGGHAWTYESTARLVKPDESWLVEFAPSVVEPSLVDGESIEVVTLRPERADVLGAGDVALVTDRPVVRVGLDKANADAAEWDTSARALAALVEVDADAFAGRVAAAGERAFVEAITMRDEDVTPEILGGIEGLPGARGISDELPLAPTRTFARPLLGTVGPATAEIISESEGAIGEGDMVGLSGLQERYDETLRGTPGLVVRAVAPADGETGDEAGGDAAAGADAAGTQDGVESDSAEPTERELFRAAAVDGTPLALTLDAQTQQLGEQTLTAVEGAAALVAIRPSDGHVLAAAGTSPDGYSVATLGQYPPGSTFKVVSALALLRAGLTPESALTCPATVTVDGREFENYDDYPASGIGDIDLRTALANSCNTAFIGARDTAEQEALAEAGAALGLGVDQELGFPAFLGAVPPEATGTAHAASMIGQGEVLASPLAMATVAASVVAGVTVVPTLVPDADGGEPVAPAAPLTGDEATALRDLMGAVVTDGSAAFLADVPGDPVIAKTGTAEFGTGSPPDTHAWMIAGQGDLAVAVFVELGESGSGTAGPLLESFLQEVQ